MQQILYAMINEYTQYSLFSHNTFGINANADTFLEYSSVEDLKQLLARKELFSKPFLHIGRGSNLLFVSDYKGTILHSRIDGIEIIDETDESITLRVGAGVVWDDFVAYCVEHKWGGAENLSLIPGEVGASAVQNIGAYGVEAGDLIEKVETVDVFTAEERVFTKADCCFSYRQSIFKAELKGKYIVTYVTYKLNKKMVYNLEYGNIKAELDKYDKIDLSTIRHAIISIRESKLPDPQIEGNAGSFFMNPLISRKQFTDLKQDYPDIPHYDVDENCVKIPAAWMIDRCGWKGKTMGNAGVHAKQALVLVNKGGATGKEIIDLSRAIQASVKERFGVNIYPEVNFIGE